MYNHILRSYAGLTVKLGACFYLTIIAVVLNIIASRLLLRASVLSMVPNGVDGSTGVVVTANPVAAPNNPNQVC